MHAHDLHHASARVRMRPRTQSWGASSPSSIEEERGDRAAEGVLLRAYAGPTATWNGVTKAVNARAAIMMTSHTLTSLLLGSMVRREMSRSRLRTCSTSAWKRAFSMWPRSPLKRIAESEIRLLIVPCDAMNRLHWLTPDVSMQLCLRAAALAPLLAKVVLITSGAGLALKLPLEYLKEPMTDERRGWAAWLGEQRPWPTKLPPALKPIATGGCCGVATDLRRWILSGGFQSSSPPNPNRTSGAKPRLARRWAATSRETRGWPSSSSNMSACVYSRVCVCSLLGSLAFLLCAESSCLEVQRG